MWIERRMSVTTQVHCTEVTLKNNTRYISSMKIDALMDSVHNADVTGDMAFPSSGTLSSRLCKSVESVPNTLLFKQPHKNQSQADRTVQRNVTRYVHIFGKVSTANVGWAVDLRSMFYQMTSTHEPTANWVFQCCFRAAEVQPKPKWWMNPSHPV
jgi:hypothetical protein